MRFLITTILFISSLFASQLPNEVIIGTRFQGVLSQQKNESYSGAKERNQDMFLRRARFEMKLLWDNGWSQLLDIRNDNSNREDRGEEKFILGDAHVEKKFKKGHTIHNLRFFRAKVDVSRSQTVSSADLIYLTRARSSDFASNYVSHNRRATNMQWNGIYHNKLQWQFAVGDGVHSDEFRDAKGNKATSLSEERLMYGGKLRYYLLGTAQANVDENFFDDKNFISLGTGLFKQDNINFSLNNSSATVDRTLTNVELTAHLGSLNIAAEYFSFSNIHLDFSNNLNQTYKSEAYYIQADYRITPKYSFFTRYEIWDKAVSQRDTDLKNTVIGLNYFHQKDAIKFGVFWDRTTFDNNISTIKEETSLLLTVMLHFI